MEIDGAVHLIERRYGSLSSQCVNQRVDTLREGAGGSGKGWGAELGLDGGEIWPGVRVSICRRSGFVVARQAFWSEGLVEIYLR